MWQDFVISSVTILFGFFLIPELKDTLRGEKINLYTSFLTSMGAYILVFTFSTLGFWFSVVGNVFCGSIWLLLFIFSLRNKMSEEKIRKNIFWKQMKLLEKKMGEKK